MSYLGEHTGLGYPVVATLGLLVGSFLNVVILRLPRRLEWAWKQDAIATLEMPEVYDPPPPGIVVEPSHCPNCKHRLSWFENIPVFSWLALRGKCRHCHIPISAQYPLIELVTCIVTIAAVWRFGFGWQGFGAALLGCFLVAGSGIDFRTRLLPDSITLPLLWLGLIASCESLYVSPKSAVLGAIAGYVSLWTVSKLFKLLRNKEGMGGGDFKLLAAIGAWGGLKIVLPTILLSSIVGAVIGSIWLLAKGRDGDTQIPFGPYLALAGWIAFFWGDAIIGGYLHAAGLQH